MDILKDKQTKDYDALSRYASRPFYYNTRDNKYIYGIGKHLSENTPFVVHKVKPMDTLDSLALFYYGRPDYYWILADFNRVDPFTNLYKTTKSIKIPSISSIYYEG